MNFQLTDEQRLLKQTVREIAQKEIKPRAAAVEASGEFPWENMRALARAGIVGLTIPVAYEGQGGTLFDAVLAMEEVAQACYITSMALLGEIGVQSQVIAHYATEAQKERILPRVARGEWMLAICMTEPDHGSDVANLRTNAVRDGDHYVVSGRKMLISRADVAEVFVTYTRFDGVPGHKGVGAILIDRGTPGLVVTERYATLGGEYLFGVAFENCRVPADHVLVREDGFKTMMSAFNGQRCLNATITLGQAQAAFDEALRYVQERKQFGQPLGSFQGLQWMLADMAIDLDAARLLIYRAAANAVGGFPSVVEAAMAKTFANEMAIRVTNQALQLFGGYGYLKAFPVERYLRGARFGAVGGGTPQIQRNLIAARLLGRRAAVRGE